MITVERNKDLSTKNTFGMKVSCACYVEYDTLEDLFKIDFSQFPLPFVHVGQGSNILFTKDFSGTIFHSLIKFLRQVGSGENEVLVEAGAGVLFDDFVEWASSMRLWGAENLSGIPGEVGAAAVQNIGAYGVEAKDIIVRVNCYDRIKEEMIIFENADCAYGYRSSFFKTEEAKGRYFITSVLFHLSGEYSPKLDYGNVRESLAGRSINSPGDVRRSILGIRGNKLPDPRVIGSAGSFFKNPVITQEQFDSLASSFRREHGDDHPIPHYEQADGIKVPAAWMIEQCGLKGRTCGGAAVYEQQPLVLVNRTGSATPEDVLTLEQEIISAVRERFGVTLQPEVEHL